MAKIMRTLWDESAELSDETLSPRPVLSDDYTTGDVEDLQETIEDNTLDADSLEDAFGE